MTNGNVTTDDWSAKTENVDLQMLAMMQSW